MIYCILLLNTYSIRTLSHTFKGIPTIENQLLSLISQNIQIVLDTFSTRVIQSTEKEIESGDESDAPVRSDRAQTAIPIFSNIFDIFKSPFVED